MTTKPDYEPPEAIEVELHPSVMDVLQYFEYSHLPSPLMEISRQLSGVAWGMAATLKGPELTVGLRKLLEAKDCFVRAALPKKKPAADGAVSS